MRLPSTCSSCFTTLRYVLPDRVARHILCDSHEALAPIGFAVRPPTTISAHFVTMRVKVQHSPRSQPLKGTGDVQSPSRFAVNGKLPRRENPFWALDFVRTVCGRVVSPPRLGVSLECGDPLSARAMEATQSGTDSCNSTQNLHVLHPEAAAMPGHSPNDDVSTTLHT